MIKKYFVPVRINSSASTLIYEKQTAATKSPSAFRESATSISASPRGGAHFLLAARRLRAATITRAAGDFLSLSFSLATRNLSSIKLAN